MKNRVFALLESTKRGLRKFTNVAIFPWGLRESASLQRVVDVQAQLPVFEVEETPKDEGAQDITAANICVHKALVERKR